MSDPQFEYSRFRQQVLKWATRSPRELPWREAGDPYLVWISEIMLQQTTVAAVIPYFERFLEHFPQLSDLAAAEEEQVLRLWEGLGYYSRARNLLKTARLVVEQYGGKLPSDPDQLLQLPGIGKYTAGAILSFGFGKPAPIVEANTERLFARLLGVTEEVRKSASQKQLWAFAEQAVSRRKPGKFNQAVMDLGSLVCTPKQPKCFQCPVSEHCVAHRENLMEQIPRFKPRVKPTELLELAIVIRNAQGEILLRQCGSKERWAGLWDVPRWEIEQPSEQLWQLAQSCFKKRSASRLQTGLFDDQALELMGGKAELEARSGCRLKQLRLKTALRHTVTRYKITLLVYEAELKTQTDPALWQPSQWSQQQEWDEIPLSTTGRTILSGLD